MVVRPGYFADPSGAADGLVHPLRQVRHPALAREDLQPALPVAPLQPRGRVVGALSPKRGVRTDLL